MKRPRFASVCHNPECRRHYLRASGEDLFCSLECGARARAIDAGNIEKLKALGFCERAGIPNCWEKEGTILTIEGARHHGLEGILAIHAKVVRAKTADGPRGDPTGATPGGAGAAD